MRPSHSNDMVGEVFLIIFKKMQIFVFFPQTYFDRNMQQSFLTSTSTTIQLINIADIMADLRQTFAGNHEAISSLEFYAKADKKTRSLFLAQIERMDEIAQQKQREVLQRKRSFERLPQQRELVLNERNSRAGHFDLSEFTLQRTEQPPHLKRRTQRRTQSQEPRRAVKHEATYRTNEQFKQQFGRWIDDQGTFESAPFSKNQLGLAKSHVDLRFPSLTETPFKPLPSNSSHQHEVAASQAYKPKKEEQRRNPRNHQVEKSKLKKSSQALQKSKQWYDKCAVPPHAIYQDRKEEQSLADIAYRTAGLNSQNPSHHFPENQRNQLTNEEIEHYYSNN